MKKGKMLLTLLGLLILTLALSGCGLFAKFGTVSGTLKWADDDSAVVGAEVLIADLSATSDENGAYSVEKVPYGDYTMEVKFEGNSVHTQDVVVNEKAIVADMNITWVAQFGTVSGVVKWTDGSAISGASVAIDGKTVTTGSNGAYTVEDVTYGDRTIEVSIGDVVVYTQDISIQARNITQNVEVAKVGTLSGTVSRATNLGLAGASVFLTKGTSQVAATTTDYTGTFTFADLPFDSYNIKIAVGAKEYHTTSATIDKIGVTTVPATTVAIEGGVIWEQGFEIVAPDALPVGHTAFAGPGGLLSTTVKRSGSNGWEIRDLGTGKNNGLKTVSVPIIPGKTYTATAYYTWEGYNAGSFYFEFQDAEFKRVGVVSKTLAKDEGWSSWDLTLLAPENAVYAAVIIYYTGSANSRVTYFDDLKIVELLP